jgi:hypothetical protein
MSGKLRIIAIVNVSYRQLERYLEMCANVQSDNVEDDDVDWPKYSTDPTLPQSEWEKQTVINKFPDWGAAHHGPDLEGLTDDEWAALGLPPGGGTEGLDAA